MDKAKIKLDGICLFNKNWKTKKITRHQKI